MFESLEAGMPEGRDPVSGASYLYGPHLLAGDVGENGALVPIRRHDHPRQPGVHPLDALHMLPCWPRGKEHKCIAQSVRVTFVNTHAWTPEDRLRLPK